MTDSNQFNIEFSGHVTIERMFDIHDNQNVQIINNIKNDNDPKSDFKVPEKRKIKSRRTQTVAFYPKRYERRERQNKGSRENKIG